MKKLDFLFRSTRHTLLFEIVKTLQVFTITILIGPCLLSFNRPHPTTFCFPLHRQANCPEIPFCFSWSNVFSGLLTANRLTSKAHRIPDVWDLWDYLSTKQKGGIPKVSQMGRTVVLNGTEKSNQRRQNWEPGFRDKCQETRGISEIWNWVSKTSWQWS